MTYEKEYEKCANDLKNETVCLAIDGWSNIHNEPIICVTVTTSTGQTYLIDTVDTSDQCHTAEYLLQFAQSSIKKCEKNFGCCVGSIMTDNAANITKMHKLLEESAEQNIIYGCAAHLLNLLAHDLEIDDVKEHVCFVAKYFRNNHYAGGKYCQDGGQHLVMPQETKWNTMSDCLKIYVNNWPILMKLCEVDREMIDPAVRSKVSNIGFKRSAEELLARLQPIANALDQVQRDKCTTAHAVNIWKELCEHHKCPARGKTGEKKV